MLLNRIRYIKSEILVDNVPVSQSFNNIFISSSILYKPTFLQVLLLHRNVVFHSLREPASLERPVCCHGGSNPHGQ